MSDDLGSGCWVCGRAFAADEPRRGAELPPDAARVTPIRNVLLCLPCADRHARPIPGRRYGLRLDVGPIDPPPSGAAPAPASPWFAS